MRNVTIVSPSTPPGTDLNLAEESYSTWLDYVGPLITDELDSKKCWSYRDPDGNVQGSFSLAQLRKWKDYFPSDLKIWSYYGNVKETILLHSALKRRTKDAGKISLHLWYDATGVQLRSWENGIVKENGIVEKVNDVEKE
ncbi:zinc finger CCCH domain-containing protein 19 [Tanacetum coccineum]|uniref:Zinc finger CCCH domain-containing protein 19 n=1 Tax=Tanacetum coccineum TaxID=301880 RepID=A0ABQ5BB10_9ASTR